MKRKIIYGAVFAIFLILLTTCISTVNAKAVDIDEILSDDNTLDDDNKIEPTCINIFLKIVEEIIRAILKAIFDAIFGSIVLA